MTSSSTPVQATSTAIVRFDPSLPHVSLRSHVEKIVNEEVFRRSLEAAQRQNQLTPLPQVWKEKIVMRIAQGLNYLYVDKKLGSKMALVIARNFRNGNYDASTNPYNFKQLILEDLKKIYPDKHLFIGCSKDPIPDYDPDRSLRTLHFEELTPQQQELVIDRNAAGDLEIQAYVFPDTKVGYLKINLFPDIRSPGTQTLIDQAMQQVVDADSLIIDLRDNRGGEPETVAFLASYFFDSKQVINQVYDRAENSTTPSFAEPEQLEQRFGGKKPIYILTNANTFSAGEELAYDLQSAKRGKVIGQRTEGGAHPMRSFVVDDYIFVFIPYQKPINPHTGANWEGTGVLPDYPLPEGTDALAFARTKLLGKQ